MLNNNEILFSREQLKQRAKELGAQITEDYKGKNLLVVGILKGSVPFMADLISEINNDELEIDFISASSYNGGTVSSGVLKILKDLNDPIEGKNVLIVEDIVDTGITLTALKAELLKRNPASLKICTCLNKPCRRRVEIEPDYCGFVIDDKFIVGYGLDIEQKYRQLPYITWIKE